MSEDRRVHSNVAFAYLAPAFLVMLVTGVLPLVMVFNYAFQDVFSGDQFYWVGTSWFQSLLSSPEFFATLGRSILFSLLVLAIEVPLGLYIALRIPARGAVANLLIIVAAIPLLTPFIVVGYAFKILVNPGGGLLSAMAGLVGLSYDMNNTVVAWITLLLMDAWHWTSLVVLLCYAGLRAIPEAYYQAASIDGADKWSIFKHVQLPRLKRVLLIAVLLRFVDSFVIYSEAYVMTRGGPDVSTSFFSQELVQTALIQFDLGEGGAMSVIYFLITLSVAWAFYTLLMPRRRSTHSGGAT